MRKEMYGKKVSDSNETNIRVIWLVKNRIGCLSTAIFIQSSNMIVNDSNTQNFESLECVYYVCILDCNWWCSVCICVWVSVGVCELVLHLIWKSITKGRFMSGLCNWREKRMHLDNAERIKTETKFYVDGHLSRLE